MAYILNIETATKNCSVGIAEDGVTLNIKEFAGQGFSHAEQLHVFIKEVLRESGLKFDELAAIAVSKGPGSYTGLRIGVSAAKGLCYSLEIPLLAIDTLQILASKVKGIERDALVIPMLDARRMEVYSAIFDADINCISEVQAQIIDGQSFREITKPVYFVGDGVQKCRSIIQKNNFKFLENVLYPSAKEMGLLSFSKYKISDTVDVAYFEPYYLKDFFFIKKD